MSKKLTFKSKDLGAFMESASAPLDISLEKLEGEARYNQRKKHPRDHRPGM